MRQQKIILLLVILAIALTIILTSSVGYARVTEVAKDDCVLSPEKTNFRVKFYGTPTVRGNGETTLKLTGDTTAVMNINGLKSVGDSVTATFGIINNSKDIEAVLSKSVTNSNEKYFKVTVTLSNDELAPKKGKATLKVKVELIKTPINVEKANICVRVMATPNN